VVVSTAVTVPELRDILPFVVAHIVFERSASVPPTDWAERTARLVAAGRLTVFIARAGREPVGYATMTTDVETWSAEPFAHLDCVFVDESRRGAGIGGKLIDAVANDARSRGLGELQWQTPEWNDSAVRFYEKLGATHRAKRRFTLVL
jgi:GNAT superfamily N-acetyltransferase